MLGAPGDGGVGVPAAGARGARVQGAVLLVRDGAHLHLLRAGRDPQQLHLGPALRRYAYTCSSGPPYFMSGHLYLAAVSNIFTLLFTLRKSHIFTLLIT